MPELPEVETVARGLARRVIGDEIESVWLGSKPEPLKSTAREIQTTLEGTRIKDVRRVGKHIVVDLDSVADRKPRKSRSESKSNAQPKVDKRQWIIHLGMTGRLLVTEPAVEIAKHTHAIVKLASGRELRFVDARRFGRLAVVRHAEGFQGPGSEPLTIKALDFAGLFQGRKTFIKAALLNQSLLHGVGNIYADESLFRAGIRPRRRADDLAKPELKKLHGALQKVLKEAIKLGGSSVSDYVDADGNAGFFQLRHYVYMRTGKPCLVCDTPIKRIVVAGRGTHYCPQCQR